MRPTIGPADGFPVGVAGDRGREAAAQHCFAEVADVRDHRDPYEAAMTQLNHAALAVVRGDPEGAAELLGRVQATLDRAGIVLDPDDAFEVDRLRDQLGSQIDS